MRIDSVDFSTESLVNVNPKTFVAGLESLVDDKDIVGRFLLAA